MNNKNNSTYTKNKVFNIKLKYIYINAKLNRAGYALKYWFSALETYSCMTLSKSNLAK